MKKPVILLLLIMAGHRSFSQCTATAAMDGASFGNDASIGTLSWFNPGNAVSSDNSDATAGQLVGILSTVQTRYITAQGFGFAIPPGAAICGIEVQVERYAAGLIIGSSLKDNSVRLIKNGTITGADLSAGANWLGGEAIATFGSGTNQWGTSWTPADINAGNFGVAISARLSAGLAALFLTAHIDNIKITVYYDFLLAPSPLNNVTMRDNIIAARNHTAVKGAVAYTDLASHRAVLTCHEKMRGIELFDINMRRVKTVEEVNGVTAVVSTAGMAPGMYVARVTTQANRIYTAKLLAQ